MPKNGYGVYQIAKEDCQAWFHEIVTSRRTNHDHKKDKKNW